MKCQGCLERLQRMPGWWIGAAFTRREMAKRAPNDKERDEHLRIEADYLRRAKLLENPAVRRIA
jgi:hypothetical protein